jgi:hypothetical protein
MIEIVQRKHEQDPLASLLDFIDPKLHTAERYLLWYYLDAYLRSGEHFILQEQLEDHNVRARIDLEALNTRRYTEWHAEAI